MANDNQTISILSLDGGGVRGISTLYILKELMAQIRRERRIINPQDNRPSPRPCDVFNLICGTSTGGLIAIMLGRLGMSVEDVIQNYKTLSEEIFTSVPTSPRSKFDAKILEARFKEIIAATPLKSSPDLHPSKLLPDTPLKDSPKKSCKIFVVSTRTRAGGAAVRMRSYDTFTSDAFDEPIWKAARATSAAPTIFDPIVIGDVTYGDGGTGWNNPAEEAITEARNIWPNRKIRCVVSLGTGLEKALQLDDGSHSMPPWVAKALEKTSPHWSFKDAFAEYCVECLMSCERIHNRVTENLELLGLDNKYFRLNVPQGMSEIGFDEWEKLRDMIALTKGYMDTGDIKRMKRKIATLLLNP